MADTREPPGLLVQKALERVPPNLRPLCVQNLERKAKADGNLDLLRAIKDYRSLMAKSPQSSGLTSGATKVQKSKARNGSIDEFQRHFETLTIEQLFDAIDSMALEPEVSFNYAAAAMLCCIDLACEAHDLHDEVRLALIRRAVCLEGMLRRSFVGKPELARFEQALRATHERIARFSSYPHAARMIINPNESLFEVGLIGALKG